MPTFNWKELLTEWSQELLDSDSYSFYKTNLPSKVLANRWLGFPGASEEQIAQAEKRLGTGLPSSYREFLKVSNGWRKTTPFIDEIWSAEKIDWFPHCHQDWIDAWIEGAGGIYPVSDEEYFVYGSEQDATNIRVEYLQTALEISPPGDAAIYLLNPKIINADGEWEAWFFANWLPGANRYPSFYEMMQEEHKIFLKLIEENTGTKTNRRNPKSVSLTILEKLFRIFTR